uniref:Zinc finger, CCHC-type n=1 Tax=Tanacetum cinerariifolium TaxID=118510 RepID=A0A6L2KTR9_TANCI|nr:zinc finger, CCHC-type [Tanacetum cinerariifolium]
MLLIIFTLIWDLLKPTIKEDYFVIMDVAAMKHMASNFAKLDKFEGVDFRRWQKKMHFLLSSMSVMYMLTTPIPEDGGDDATVEQIRKRDKWDNDDHDSLKAKYMVEDASSKKFLVSNFTNYKITNSRAVMEQYNELLDFKHTLKYLKEELNLVELGSHLHIEEFLRMQDSDKPRGNNVTCPSVVNMVEHNNSSKYNDNKDCKGGNVGDKANGSGTNGSVDGSTNSLKGHVHFKRMQDMSKDGLISAFYMDTEKDYPYELWTKRKPNLNYLRVWGCREVVRLSDPKLKIFGERGIECIFVGYAEHSKASRFYVIEPNDSVLINSIIRSMDAIFDENRFSSVPRLILRISNEIEDIGGSVVPEEDDPKAFDEAMKSQDVVFWKEAINNEMDFIMGNNTWVLANLPLGCKPLGCKWIFKRKLKVDGTIEKFKASTIRLLIVMASIHNLIIHHMDVKTALLNGYLDEEEFLSSGFSIKDMGEADVILDIRIKHEISTPMETSEKLMPNNGQAVSQLEYSRLIGCLITYFYSGAATLAKAYSQMYNGKSRHLGVRHSMIRELIMSGVISIEFVRSQQNLGDHLTKRLARDLVIKSAEMMGLKSN